MKAAQPPKKRVALKLFLLLLICLAPLIGALFVYQSRDNLQFMTKNHGALINPSVNLESLGVPLPEPKAWVLAYYTPKACDALCQRVIAHFSVMELSLVKDKPRIRTLLLSPNPLDPHTLPGEPADLLHAQTQGQLPEQLLPKGESTAIWLIDPLGNIILRYEDTALDNRMLLDLRYLLKVSQIG
jgi:hypothetical protein